MSNYYFVYDQYGNIVTAMDTYPQLSPGQLLLFGNENTPNATAAFNQRNAFMVQNGQIVSAVTLNVTRTRTTSAITETWTLNIVASDNATHTVALNISSLGYTETLEVPASGLNYVVELRNSVSSMQFMVELSGQGIVTQDVPIGGANPITNTVKAVKQADGSLLIKNTSKSNIKQYGATITVPGTDILTDLANLSDFFASGFVKLLQWAQNPTYAPLQLTTDEQNAVTDFATNYLPLARLKLSDAKPADGSMTTQNPRYPEILANKQTANAAADEVLQELADPDVTNP